MVNWGISQLSRDHSRFATSVTKLSFLKFNSVNKQHQDAQKHTNENTER